MVSQKLLIGKILGPHGVRGLVKIRSLTEEPEDLFAYGPLSDEKGTRTFALEPKGVGKDHYIVALEGVTDRNASEALKGVGLYVDRAALPEAAEGEYYLADLIGLQAQDGQGKLVGVVDATHDYGAGVFLEIKPKSGPSFMLPFKDAFVPHVDLENGAITVAVPEGWLSNEKPPEGEG